MSWLLCELYVIDFDWMWSQCGAKVYFWSNFHCTYSPPTMAWALERVSAQTSQWQPRATMCQKRLRNAGMCQKRARNSAIWFMEFASTLSQPKVFWGRKGQEQDIIRLMTQCQITFTCTRPNFLFVREGITHWCRQNIFFFMKWRQNIFERGLKGSVVRIFLCNSCVINIFQQGYDNRV